MYSVRLFSVRRARFMEILYETFEGTMLRLAPLVRRIGYSRLEKPLVTPYIPTTGSLEVGYFASSNGYHTDSLFKSDVRYTY